VQAELDGSSSTHDVKNNSPCLPRPGPREIHESKKEQSLYCPALEMSEYALACFARQNAADSKIIYFVMERHMEKRKIRSSHFQHELYTGEAARARSRSFQMALGSLSASLGQNQTDRRHSCSYFAKIFCPSSLLI
jgi:hypothetical protein